MLLFFLFHLFIWEINGSFSDDFSLIKNLRNFGISASIRRLDKNHRVNRFAYSNYKKLGVFIDSRCSHEEIIESVLTAVRFIFTYIDILMLIKI